MNALELRKQLLIAESELNRAQLVAEWQTMSGEVHILTRKAKNIGYLAFAATFLAGLGFVRRQKAASAAEKPGWWQTILKGAGLFSTVCQAFYPSGSDSTRHESPRPAQNA